MNGWLTVCGAGLAPGPDTSSAASALTLARSHPAHPDIPPQMDLATLPELLRGYYGDAQPPTLRRVPRYARMGLLAALHALREAGWNKAPDGAPDTALLIGTAYSGVEMSMNFMDSLLDQGPRLSSPTAFSHAVNNMGAGLLSLLLDLRGPCQTISQFELSFAGALQAAALLLDTGRVRRALVGALDETDARFTRCCPEAAASPCGKPPVEGAVFLCLEATEGDAATPQLRICWEQETNAAPTLLSGAADATDGLRLETQYGHAPFSQALDVFLALRDSTPALHCLCSDTAHRHTARVDIRRRAAC